MTELSSIEKKNSEEPLCWPNYTSAGRVSDLMEAPWLGLDALSFVGTTGVQLLDATAFRYWSCCWERIFFFYLRVESWFIYLLF